MSRLVIQWECLQGFRNLSWRGEGFKTRRDSHWSLTSLENVARNVTANESTMMDSARDAAAASDAVILPRLWATLKEPPPGWLCPIKFKLGFGEVFKGPFAKSFEPSDETEKLLV